MFKKYYNCQVHVNNKLNFSTEISNHALLTAILIMDVRVPAVMGIQWTKLGSLMN